MIRSSLETDTNQVRASSESLLLSVNQRFSRSPEASPESCLCSLSHPASHRALHVQLSSALATLQAEGSSGINFHSWPCPSPALHSCSFEKLPFHFLCDFIWETQATPLRISSPASAQPCLPIPWHAHRWCDVAMTKPQGPAGRLP